MLPQSSLKKLQQAQNKCIKLINGHQPTLHNLAGLKMLYVQDLLALENKKFHYKIYHRELPECIVELMTSDQTGISLSKSHKYNTRKKKLLSKPKASSKLYRNCIIYKGTDSLLTLKAETVNKPNIYSFTRACKNMIFEEYS